MQEFVSLTILMFSYRAQMPAQMTRDCTIVIHWLTRVSAGLLQYLHKLNSLSMITLFRPLTLPGAMSFYIMPLALSTQIVIYTFPFEDSITH